MPSALGLVAIYPCCRYAAGNWENWNWRRIKINHSDPESRHLDEPEEILYLDLDANQKITSVTGNCDNETGTIWMLQAKLSDGSTWEWGPFEDTKLNSHRSERPSPSSPPLVLSHLSGDETDDAHILRFHWRPQWGGGSDWLIDYFCSHVKPDIISDKDSTLFALKHWYFWWGSCPIKWSKNHLFLVDKKLLKHKLYHNGYFLRILVWVGFSFSSWRVLSSLYVRFIDCNYLLWVRLATPRSSDAGFRYGAEIIGLFRQGCKSCSILPSGWENVE